MINFDRNQVEPPSIGKKYDTPEVYDALRIVFHRKCYLCETRKLKAENFEIEHFKAHGGDDELKYSWNNLYLACRDCNLYKGTLSNILDPCNPDEDVEKLIVHKLEPLEYIPKFIPLHPSNKKIVNTCKLLDKIHNGSNEKSVNKTEQLREAIQKRAHKLKIAIINYYRNVEKNEVVERYKALDEIKQICSRLSPYTMLMRDIANRHIKPKDLDGIFD